MSKRWDVIIVDVGPECVSTLNTVSDALFQYIFGKMVFSKQHQTAIVLTGSNVTKNDCHDEFAAQGDDAQYLNINIADSLKFPDRLTLTMLRALKPGMAACDYGGSLIVALDHIIRKQRDMPATAAAIKRIAMVSNFHAACAALDDDEIAEIATSLKDVGARLDVACINYGDNASKSAATNQQQNLGVLRSIAAASGVQHRVENIRNFAALCAFFKFPEVGYSKNAHDLVIGRSMSVEISVFSKTTQTKPPSLKAYSDLHKAAGATHEVLSSTEWRDPRDPDNAIEPDMCITGYKYGRQWVPIRADDFKLNEYRPQKGMWLLGFVDPENAPRHLYAKGVSIILPKFAKGARGDKGAAAHSEVVLSALCQAMRRTNKVGIVRFVARANARVELAVITPNEQDPDHPDGPVPPDHLILNRLPFGDEIRGEIFPSLLNPPPQKAHNDEQLRLMHELISHSMVSDDASVKRETVDDVKSNDVKRSGHHTTLPPPEGVVNVGLRRMLQFFADKGLDPTTQIPDPCKDRLFQEIMVPDLPRACDDVIDKIKAMLPAADAADGVDGVTDDKGDALDFEARFAVDGVVAFAATRVGTISPEEDFNAMIKAGNVDAAVDGMVQVINQLVDESIGDRLYGKAQRCVLTLRIGCIAQHKARAFNEALHDLAAKYKSFGQRQAFWKALIQAGVTLISADESNDSDVSAADAAAFLSSHAAEPAAAAAMPAVAAADDEDEFADMD